MHSHSHSLTLDSQKKKVVIRGFLPATALHLTSEQRQTLASKIIFVERLDDIGL